ncbi:hypothetical protein ADUPG1_005673, partial [Aduncisulcus paluster]
VEANTEPASTRQENRNQEFGAPSTPTSSLPPRHSLTRSITPRRILLEEEVKRLRERERKRREEDSEIVRSISNIDGVAGYSTHCGDEEATDLYAGFNSDGMSFSLTFDMRIDVAQSGTYDTSAEEIAVVRFDISGSGEMTATDTP